jgi:hypothetical protein
MYYAYVGGILEAVGFSKSEVFKKLNKRGWEYYGFDGESGKHMVRRIYLPPSV